MPTREHEAPLLLLRERPELAIELLRDVLGVSVPPHTEVRIEPADFTQVFPVEFRADLAITLRRDGAAVLGIIVEVQRREDPDKPTAWPLYNAVFHAKLRCPIALIVISEDERTARWAAKPITTLQVGSSFIPLVIGPSRVPVVNSDEEAVRSVELAVLSTLVHGQSRGLEVGGPAAHATASLDLSDERRTLYLDLILSALRAEDRARLQAEMNLTGYKFKSETYKRMMAEDLEEAVAAAKAESEAGAVLTVLSARNLPVSDAIRAQITACTDLPTLERWLQRAATAASAEDVVRE